ncbi:MAG: hypothetical protein JXA51_05260 [Dehalococcoidales bacterium]|nr:hypothetical protein [Dehalococcoidales bacterium]
MSITLKYSKFNADPSEAYPRRVSVSRPVIPIQLINGQERISYLALIDSGADSCILHASIGETIGIAIESGKLEVLHGVTGKELKAYFHNIKIDVEGYEFDCYAGFSREIEHAPYGILGQTGFFDVFDIIFDYNKRRIELNMK